MASYIANDSDLTLVADAIRSKGKTTESLVFPNEFVNAIAAISTGGTYNLQSKTITPSTSTQTILPDTNYDALSSVTVESIPSAYIIPTGTKTITTNGIVDVTNYASANVNVPTDSMLSLQSKTATPTEQQQTVSPDSGYDGLSQVTVEAISSNYVGSSIIRDPQLTSRTASNHSVIIEANSGYYSQSQSVEIPAFQHGDPTGRYSGRDGNFYFTFPIVTSGYWDTNESFSINPANITGINVRTGDLTITPTESSQQIATYGDFIDGTITVDAISSTYIGSAVDMFTSEDVTINGPIVEGPSGGYWDEGFSVTVSAGTEGTPTVTKGSVSNHNVTITPSVTNTTGYITGGTKTGAAVSVSASELVSGTLSITANGTFNVTNYASANVAVPSSAPSLQSKTVTPTESQQSIQPDNGYDGLSVVTINAIPSIYVGSGVTTKTAATITPGTTNQTIASGTYLTGTQTIMGDADLTAANIKTGVQIFGVTGSYTSDATASAADIVNGKTGYVNGSKITGGLIIQRYYTGTSTPSSSLGSNGDIYVQQ